VNYFFHIIAAAATAAAIVALGSAFPIVQSTFAQDGDTNTVDTCTGQVGNNADCRLQGCQIGSGNTQGDLTFKDGDTSTTNTTEGCQKGSGNTQGDLTFGD
jgi:hypothetical protein